MMSKTKFMSEVRRCLLNSMAIDACRGSYIELFPGFSGITVWEMLCEDFDTDSFDCNNDEHWNAARSYCEDYVNECVENDDQLLWIAYKANVIDYLDYFGYVSDVPNISELKFTQREYADLKKNAKVDWPRGCCTKNKLNFIYETGYFNGCCWPIGFDATGHFIDTLEDYHL